MRIKKMYQGGLPENKILNIQSESSTDTYSCDYINNLNFSVDELDELPVDSIIEYVGTEVPDGWELVEETNIGKSLISISGGGERTYTIGAWVWTPIDFNEVIRNLGDGFEYDTETYEIKALKNMTVKIDAQISYFGTASGEMNVAIVKNKDQSNGNIAYANQYETFNNHAGTLNIVSAITDVVAGDTIQIIFSGLAGTYKINQRNFISHMTVEEISNPVISINGVESIETKEKNYIQCGFTENFWVPDTNYKLLTFDNIKIGGEVFSYDSETNEVVINENYNINNVKLHFHTMLTTGGNLAVEAIEVLVYKNDAIAVIINDGLDNKSSRSATSLDYIVDCAPGDRFRVEARSYSNTYQMLATYGRTAFTIEEVVDNNITVSEDNSNSEWKLLQANVPAKTTVDISNLDFNELYIEARVGTQAEANANFIQTFHILKASLSDEVKYYRHGAYFYTSYNGASVIQATLTSIMSTDNYFNGNVVNDYTFVDIYYR